MTQRSDHDSFYREEPPDSNQPVDDALLMTQMGSPMWFLLHRPTDVARRMLRMMPVDHPDRHQVELLIKERTENAHAKNQSATINELTAANATLRAQLAQSKPKPAWLQVLIAGASAVFGWLLAKL